MPLALGDCGARHGPRSTQHRRRPGCAHRHCPCSRLFRCAAGIETRQQASLLQPLVPTHALLKGTLPGSCRCAPTPLEKRQGEVSRAHVWRARVLNPAKPSGRAAPLAPQACLACGLPASCRLRLADGAGAQPADTEGSAQLVVHAIKSTRG